MYFIKHHLDSKKLLHIFNLILATAHTDKCSNSLFAELGLTASTLQTFIPMQSIFNAVIPSTVGYQTELHLILVQGGTVIPSWEIPIIVTRDEPMTAVKTFNEVPSQSF